MRSGTIDKVILAHRTWRQRLTAAIKDGVSVYSVQETSLDTSCELGAWLYSLPVELRRSELGSEIQRLHAEFHKEAARILDLALRGEQHAAVQALQLNGKFRQTSGRLTVLLKRWRD